MRRNGHKTTSCVKFDLKFDFSAPNLPVMTDTTRNLQNWTKTSGIFSPIFCCACAERAIKLLPVKFLTQNLKPPCAVSYATTNFGGTYYKIYACFVRKVAFVMQNFRNLWLVGVGVTLLWRNPQKAHPWLISCISSHYASKSVQGFFL